MNGSQSCFRWNLATHLKSPRVSNWPGYACFNPSTVVTSGLGLRSSQSIVTSPIFSHVCRPTMGADGTSTR